MKLLTKKILAILLIVTCCLTGCGTPGYEESNLLTYEEAVEELSSKLTKVNTSTVDVLTFVKADES